MTPGIVRWRQKASARIFCPVPETSCTWICALWTAHCQHFSFREIWAFILLDGWNCPVLSAGRTDGTVQEKPGKGESNLSSQPFTLHFSPLFSREGWRRKSCCGCPVLNLACDITDGKYHWRALSEMCASAGIYGEEAGVEADTGRGKGNDGSENLPKASDSSFAGK